MDLEAYRGESKFYHEKSMISVAGQLQFSGMSNAVIISKSDLLNKESLMSSCHVNEILELFS
ncbi:hypothetical protein [uncultured Ilyobacter sp.]|uniref:hypothetical protein n=1 Tax=uncultured Ilyobacter sp. TaxID=544433 RepID=UPI0029BFD864|nr:hypothetical protein [uncultured Ilyobacter sp.]